MLPMKPGAPGLRLCSVIVVFSGMISLGGSTLGAAARLFANLKQKLTGTDASIIAAVEAGEDHVKAAYQQVITDGELSDPLRMAVESEFAQIQATMTR